MRIVLTGSKGFIGQHYLEHIKKDEPSILQKFHNF